MADSKVKKATQLAGTVAIWGLKFPIAWFVMIGLGAAHDQWAVIPPLGYWTTLAILFGLGGIAGTIHGGMQVKLKDD